MKLYFFGSESLAQSEYLEAGGFDDEYMKYLRSTEAHMLAVINQFGISGLAAPQLGFDLQMIVVKVGRGENARKMTLLNPSIERMYGAETEYAESCISCPPGGNQCPVARMQYINVIARSLEQPGQVLDLRFTGRDARIVQHEIDHLHGTFFFDRANLVEKAHVLERFHVWKRTFRNSPNFGLGGKNGRATTRTQAKYSRELSN